MFIQLVLGELLWLCAQLMTSQGTPMLLCDGPFRGGYYHSAEVAEVVEAP